MKIRRFLSVLGLAYGFGLMSGAGPHLTFSPGDTVDFGKFDGQNVQTKDIYIKNTGDEPLQILSTYRGCTCSSLDYSHEDIQPGDSIVMKITLDARNRKPGQIRKSIRVTSNADNRVMAIFLKGEVAKPFQAD